MINSISSLTGDEAAGDSVESTGASGSSEEVASRRPDTLAATTRQLEHSNDARNPRLELPPSTDTPVSLRIPKMENAGAPAPLEGPMCIACDGPIHGTSLLAGGKQYHPDHFRYCHSCAVSLVDPPPQKVPGHPVWQKDPQNTRKHHGHKGVWTSAGDRGLFRKGRHGVLRVLLWRAQAAHVQVLF